MMVNLPCLMVSYTNFLRPTCSYTECQRSSYAGSWPHGLIPCRLQLLFVPESSLTNRWHQMVLNISADASPALSGGSLYRYGAICSAIGLVLPGPSPVPEWIAGNPSGFWMVCHYYLLSLPDRRVIPVRITLLLFSLQDVQCPSAFVRSRIGPLSSES